MNTMDVLNPRNFLATELARRCKTNPRYSLTRFAKTLSMSPAALSLFLSGKRNISKKLAAQVVARLGLEPQIGQAFLNGCNQIHNLDFQQIDINKEYETLLLDKYEIISDWQHYAILSLIETKDFVPSIQWISTRLGISLAEAKLAIERLTRVGVLDIQDKHWKQIGKPIKVENTVSTSATKKHQKQMIEKALDSLENDPIEIRDMSSMTMAIDPALVSLALTEIRGFRRKLAKLLESRGNQKEVYHLAVQLYPVSKRKH
jgi:uncharacterized protein (TIGR02147 family)